MPVLVVPNVFVNGTIADATQVDANFNAVSTIVNGLDWVNVGANGFFASQIIPTTVAQAAFGGNFGYTFNPNNAAQVPLTLQGVTGQSVDLFDVFLAGVKDIWIDDVATLHLLTQLTFGAAGALATNVLNIGGATDIATGCHWNGTNYIADDTTALIMRFQGGAASPCIIFANSGLTVGVAFTPTIAWSTSATGNLQMPGTGQIIINPMTFIGTNGAGATYLMTGAQWNGTAWIAQNTSATIFVTTASSGTALNMYHNDGLTIGVAFVPTLVLACDGAGNLTCFGNFAAAGSVRPAGASPFGGARSFLWSGSGIPPAGGGASGDYYLRADGGGAGATHIYFKNGASWIGIA